MASDRVIVFIEGIMPTDAERALAKEHETSCFVTLTAPQTGHPSQHKYAVCVPKVKLPAGYTSLEDYKAPKKAAPVAPAAAPTGNPGARLPLTPPGAPGSRGLASE